MPRHKNSRAVFHFSEAFVHALFNISINIGLDTSYGGALQAVKAFKDYDYQFSKIIDVFIVTVLEPNLSTGGVGFVNNLSPSSILIVAGSQGGAELCLI